MTECPKCGSALLRNAKSCPCGWGSPHRRTEDQADSHTCAYEANGLRCKYPGSMAQHFTGPWYCRVHFREGGTRFAQQCLEQSQDYGRQAPPKPNDDLAELSYLTEHFPMRPDETRAEYNQRCRSAVCVIDGGSTVYEVVETVPSGFRIKPMAVAQPVQRQREPGEDMVEF